MVGAVGETASMKRRKLWKTGEDGLCCSSSAIQTRLDPSSLLEERSETPIVFVVSFVLSATPFLAVHLLRGFAAFLAVHLLQSKFSRVFISFPSFRLRFFLLRVSIVFPCWCVRIVFGCSPSLAVILSLSFFSFLCSSVLLTVYHLLLSSFWLRV